MNQLLKWLENAEGTAWSALGAALSAGLPVPGGFVVFPRTTEREIRDAYENLKIREKTHYVAVRGPSHALLNVIGPDMLVHTLRRFWNETPDAQILVQRMVPATWCGRSARQEGGLIIKANEGMMVFDPDTYVMRDGQCIEKQIRETQRRMIRHVDGSTKTIEIKNAREGLSAEQLKSLIDLADRAKANLSWALDDQDRAWLISIVE